jgi:hypothetical protein
VITMGIALIVSPAFPAPSAESLRLVYEPGLDSASAAAAAQHQGAEA